MKLLSITLLVVFLSATVVSGSIWSKLGKWFKKSTGIDDMVAICAQLRCYHDAITDSLNGTEHLRKWQQYDVRYDPEREILGSIPEIGFAGPHICATISAQRALRMIDIFMEDLMKADREVYNRTKANIEQRCHQEEKPREVTNNE